MMLRNILPLYKNAILFPSFPDHSYENYHLFFDEAENEWVGIPKENLPENELRLLKSLYPLAGMQMAETSSKAKSWIDFLFNRGTGPKHDVDTKFRFIQFCINGTYQLERSEVESALKGFFAEDVLIIWENDSRGSVIEEMTRVSQPEKEFASISDTLESDFFVKMSFYIGKPVFFSNQLPAYFQAEREYFDFGRKHLAQTRILSFEHVFPAYVAWHLPEKLTDKMNEAAAGVFDGDPEMFTTIKTYLENNLNASLTAKKLYIHRNTLQYRIDKFVEKTGIGLKDFYGAFTVFLACLLYDKQEK